MYFLIIILLLLVFIYFFCFQINNDNNIGIQENFLENATNSCLNETPNSIELNKTSETSLNTSQTELFKPDPLLYTNLSIVEKESEAALGEAPIGEQLRAPGEAPMGEQLRVPGEAIQAPLGTRGQAPLGTRGQAPLRARGQAPLGTRGQAPLGTRGQSLLGARGQAKLKARLQALMRAQDTAIQRPQVPTKVSFAQSNKQPASIPIQLPGGQKSEIDALFNNISEDNEYFLKIKDSLVGLCSGCSNQCSYNLCLKPIRNNTVDTLFKIQRSQTDNTKINIKNVATDRYLSVCSNCIYMCPNTICCDRINPNISFTQFTPKINDDNTISFIGTNGNYLQIMEKEFYPSCYTNCETSGIIASNGVNIDKLSKFEIIPIL